MSALRNNWPILTATSLTARQINRRIILNTIFKNQPVSRADTARITGLQRSTVSLIVDELKDQHWIVEKELGRIPRGRRPIYLAMNPEGRFLGIHISESTLEAALSDLTGTVLWTAALPIKSPAIPDIRSAMKSVLTSITTEMSAQLKENDSLKSLLKGVGVSLDLVKNVESIDRLAEEIFEVCAVVDNVAVAIGELYLLQNAKAQEISQGHLVSVHAGSHLITQMLVNSAPLRGANNKAGAWHGYSTKPEAIADRLKFILEAYDPGIILVSGPFAHEANSLRETLKARLKELGSSPDILDLLVPAPDENLYVRGAISLITNHFLSECDI